MLDSLAHDMQRYRHHLGRFVLAVDFRDVGVESRIERDAQATESTDNGRPSLSSSVAWCLHKNALYGLAPRVT